MFVQSVSILEARHLCNSKSKRIFLIYNLNFVKNHGSLKVYSLILASSGLQIRFSLRESNSIETKSVCIQFNGEN